MAPDRWRCPHYVNYVSLESVRGLAGPASGEEFTGGVAVTGR